MDKEHIKIILKLSKQISAKINLEGKTYLIESEDLGIKNHTVRTYVHHKGKIISSYEADYKDIIDDSNFDKRFIEFIKTQQLMAIENFKLDLFAQKKTYKDYIKELDILIKINDEKEAMQLLNRAMVYYPDNPIIFSYQGLLEAVVNKNYSKGIRICRHAFKLLRERMPLGESFFLPILYLNLGKAYFTANQKKQAHDAFKNGLEIDNKNKKLLYELAKLGLRRKFPIPFLKRSNPINKYIGKLTYKLAEQILQ